MSARYEFACQCGRKFPVETAQAGQEIVCDCGATLKIPTMMKIRRLPVWNDADATSDAQERRDAATNGTESTQAGARDERGGAAKKTSRLSSRRLGLLIVGAIAVVVSVFFFCRNVAEPNPLHVFFKQQFYSIDGKAIRRDSSPIERGDADFYFYHDDRNGATYLIDDAFVERMTPMHAYLYFNVCKDLNLSDNFYDNYESLQIRRVISLVAFGIATFVGLGLVVFALFAPDAQKQVGTMRGSDWR